VCAATGEWDHVCVCARVCVWREGSERDRARVYVYEFSTNIDSTASPLTAKTEGQKGTEQMGARTEGGSRGGGASAEPRFCWGTGPVY
jgi:hypothetical protein